jgi:hypothetical protein
MLQRGRKSVGALVAVTQPEGRRLVAPKGLRAAEKRVWQQVVDGCPSDWFASEQTELLVGYCRHVVNASVISKAVNRMTTKALLEDLIARRYNRLLGMLNRETKTIQMIATKLRLTNQSRLDPLAAGRETRFRKPKSVQPIWQDAA